MAGFLLFLLNFFLSRSGSHGGNMVPAFADESGWPDWPTGSLPHSRNLSNVPLYRYQPKKYFEFGEGWYHMFWDVERKWAVQSRFAAPGISPGHFFSLHPDGALAEMKAYSADLKDCELLRLDMSIDNLLNLTDEEALQWFYKKHFTDRYVHWAVILDTLLEQELGGDGHNNYAGHMAVMEGYNGIIFFGARAIESYWPTPGQLKFAPGGHSGGDHRDLDLAFLDLIDMREDTKCINVVIYYGHNVVRGAHTICNRRKVLKNKLFGASYAEIDAVFADDPAKSAAVDLSYERLRARTKSIKWMSKPSISLDD